MFQKVSIKEIKNIKEGRRRSYRLKYVTRENCFNFRIFPGSSNFNRLGDKIKMIMIKIIFTWLIVMIVYTIYKLIFQKERPIPKQVVIKARDGKRKIIILRNK